MVLLTICFLGSVVIIFGVVLAASSSKPEQKVTERRMKELGLARVISSPKTISIGSDKFVSVKAPDEENWLEQRISGLKLYHVLQLLVLQSRSTTTPAKVLMGSAGMLVGVMVVASLFALPLPVVLILGAVGAYVPTGWLTYKRNQRIKKFNLELPDCIETCARALRTGNSLVTAIDIVAEQATGPAKEEFSEIFKKQSYGLPLRDALLQMLERIPSTDLKVVVTGILVQRDTGGNLAEIMDRTAMVIRDRVRIQGEVRTHTAQGRLTGWILVLLPVILMLVINLVNPGYSKVLFTDPMGNKLLYAGLGLLAVGGFLIRMIVKGMEV